MFSEITTYLLINRNGSLPAIVHGGRGSFPISTLSATTSGSDVQLPNFSKNAQELPLRGEAHGSIRV